MDDRHRNLLDEAVISPCRDVRPRRVLHAGPISAVPASTGYGATFRGVTVLHAMLSSCSPGICKKNIDNGLGAAAAALRMLRVTAGTTASDHGNGGN